MNMMMRWMLQVFVVCQQKSKAIRALKVFIFVVGSI